MNNDIDKDFREVLKRTLVFRGEDILQVSGAKDPIVTHKQANLKIDYKQISYVHPDSSDERELGPGIYGCFFEKKLFYIGIFAGNGSQMTGNVIRERWRKHVGGTTFRGIKVSLCLAGITKVRENKHTGELAKSILQIDPQTMSQDRGNQATYNKFLFAERNWECFRVLDDEAMKKFQFVYVQFKKDVLGSIRKQLLKINLEAIETKLKRELQPPCNSESTGADGSTQHSICYAADKMRMYAIAQVPSIERDREAGA